MAKEKRYTSALYLMVEPELKERIKHAAENSEDRKVSRWVRRAIEQRFERERRTRQLMGA